MFGKTNTSGNEKADQAPAAHDLGKAATAADAKASQSVRGTGKSGGEASVISADLKVVGNLQSAGDLRVDGTVEGDINSGSLTVGESARITGSLVAESVRICGVLSGQVKAKSVMITKTANVEGDITYQTLAIEEGAVLEGRCRRMEPAAMASGAGKVAALKPTQPDAAVKVAPGAVSSSATGGKPLAGAVSSSGTGGKPLAGAASGGGTSGKPLAG